MMRAPCKNFAIILACMSAAGCARKVAATHPPVSSAEATAMKAPAAHPPLRHESFEIKGLVVGSIASDAKVGSALHTNCSSKTTNALIANAVRSLLPAGTVRMCGDLTTLGGENANIQVFRRKDNSVSEIVVRFDPTYFDSIRIGLEHKFGEPASQTSAVQQNGFGARFEDVMLVWNDEAGDSASLEKYVQADLSLLMIRSSAQIAADDEKLRRKKADF